MSQHVPQKLTKEEREALRDSIDYYLQIFNNATLSQAQKIKQLDDNGFQAFIDFYDTKYETSTFATRLDISYKEFCDEKITRDKRTVPPPNLILQKFKNAFPTQAMAAEVKSKEDKGKAAAQEVKRKEEKKETKEELAYEIFYKNLKEAVDTEKTYLEGMQQKLKTMTENKDRYENILGKEMYEKIINGFRINIENARTFIDAAQKIREEMPDSISNFQAKDGDPKDFVKKKIDALNILYQKHFKRMAQGYGQAAFNMKLYNLYISSDPKLLERLTAFEQELDSKYKIQNPNKALPNLNSVLILGVQRGPRHELLSKEAKRTAEAMNIQSSAIVEILKLVNESMIDVNTELKTYEVELENEFRNYKEAIQFNKNKVLPISSQLSTLLNKAELLNKTGIPKNKINDLQKHITKTEENLLKVNYYLYQLKFKPENQALLKKLETQNQKLLESLRKLGKFKDTLLTLIGTISLSGTKDQQASVLALEKSINELRRRGQSSYKAVKEQIGFTQVTTRSRAGGEALPRIAGAAPLKPLAARQEAHVEYKTVDEHLGIVERKGSREVGRQSQETRSRIPPAIPARPAQKRFSGMGALQFSDTSPPRVELPASEISDLDTTQLQNLKQHILNGLRKNNIDTITLVDGSANKNAPLSLTHTKPSLDLHKSENQTKLIKHLSESIALTRNNMQTLQGRDPNFTIHGYPLEMSLKLFAEVRRTETPTTPAPKIKLSAALEKELEARRTELSANGVYKNIIDSYDKMKKPESKAERKRGSEGPKASL